MFDMAPHLIAGQLVGLVALALCVAAFANKQDDRLLIILIFANLAFAAQFALFGSWTASAITVLVVFRIFLARRLHGNMLVMLAMSAATLGITFFTWSGAVDVFPLAAGVLGNYAMFMMRGIPLRIVLAAGALCWATTNALSGSVGALIAELLVLMTNLITIIRMARGKKDGPPTPGV